MATQWITGILFKILNTCQEFLKLTISLIKMMQKFYPLLLRG